MGKCSRTGATKMTADATSAARKSMAKLRRAPEPDILKPLIQRADSDSARSEEHTSELQSLMRISYAVFCLKKKIPQHYFYRKILHVIDPARTCTTNRLNLSKTQQQAQHRSR